MTFLSLNFLVLNKGGGSIMDMCLVLTIVDFRYSLVLLSKSKGSLKNTGADTASGRFRGFSWVL